MGIQEISDPKPVGHYLERAIKGGKLSGVDKTDARKRRQENFLTAYGQGQTIDQACATVGIQRNTYARWRDRYPDFRARMDGLRMENLSDLDPKWGGDFVSFRKTYFGMDTYYHQREIIREIETAKGGEVVLILVAPEHGKTTVLCDYVCYKIATNANERITYISEGLNHTKKFVGRVQRRMTDPTVAPEYMSRFGPFYVQGQEKKGKPWTSTHMTVFKYHQDEQDYSLEGRGWTGTIAGTRTDTMLVDDMQSRRSLNQTEKMVETFRQDFLTRPGKDGKIVIVMTRVGQGDFPERLLDEGVVDRLVCLPALDENGDPLCPEMWPAEELAKKRKKVGEITWWRNYQQAPRSALDATFTDQIIDDCKDATRVAGKPMRENRVVSIDPAIAGGCGITVWDYDTDTMGLVDVVFKTNLARIEAIIHELELVFEQYRPQDLVIETNAWQQGLREDDRFKELCQKYGVRVHEHVTGRNKYDDDLGVARMPGSMMKGEIRLPGDSEESEQRIEPLVRQWRDWRPDVPTRLRTQDCVMSAWFAWLWWLRRRSAMGSQKLQMSGLPWRPTSRAGGWKTRKGLYG